MSLAFTANLAWAPAGHAGIMATVSAMRTLIDDWKLSPEVMNRAAQLVRMTRQHDAYAEITAIFRFVRDRIRYVRDPAGVESLATPAATLRRGVGDCDDQTTLLGALLESIGYPVRLVLGDFNNEGFSHVWLQVFDGAAWIDLDPIEPTAHVGWQAPGAFQLWFEPVRSV